MIRRILTITIAVVLLLSSLSPGPVARAQDAPPPNIEKVYLKTESDGQGGATLKYEIHGGNFDHPVVYINGTGVTPVSISPFILQVQSASGIGDIFSPGLKTIVVQNSDGQTVSSTFRAEVPPQITSTDKTKVYIGDSLKIFGSGFDDNLTRLYIAENDYSVGSQNAEAIIQDEGLITVQSVKSNITHGPSSIRLTRNAGPGTDTPRGEAIQGILADYITVVRKLTGIEVERIEPNTGPVTGGTTIRMYGAEGLCSFQGNMKVYIDGVPATNVEVMQDGAGNVTGLQAVTPPGTAGAKKIVIRDASETSEYEVIPEFTYLQAGNFLTVQSIAPTQATETEEREITVTGRNVATINIGEIEEVQLQDGSYDSTNEQYILKFTGIYQGQPVDIERRIKLTVGAVARITDIPTVYIDGDELVAVTPVITLDPQVPQTVDVVVNTETIVKHEDSGTEQLRRTEEYIKEDAFTYIPSRTYPEITSITPDKGPCDQDIYITIEGSKFQVLTVQQEIDGETQDITLYPVVRIGDKVIDPQNPDFHGYMEVYDAEGNRVDGSKYTLGTIISTKIPAQPETTPRYVDVTVINPDQGSRTVENMFEFKKPDRPAGDMPEIISIQPDKGSVDGGESAVIYGRNFDSDRENIIVTIGGAAAQVVSVNSSGTQIEVITPPGTEGYKAVQVINQDGSMATLEDGYYYTKVSSSPVIDVIAPDQGGAGTQVIIKGQDFFPPEPESDLMHKKFGTRVLLDGVDIDDYTVDQDGNRVTDPEGKRTEVIDRFTIRITIPSDLAVGSKDVTVVNPDTASYTVEDGFDYRYPASSPRIYDITGDGKAIDPAQGTVHGGTVVTIEGEDFREGVRVFFGGSEATDVTVNGNRTVIQATTSEYTINDRDKDNEKVDVTVVNYDGGSVTAQNAFTYMIPYSSPVITSIQPDFGSAAGGETVVIRGRDFREKDNEGQYQPPKVYFGGREAQSVRIENDNIIYAVTPSYHQEGKVDVTIVNADAGTYILRAGFEYRRSKPEIASIIPDKGSRMGNQEIVIHGSDFRKADLSSYYEGETVSKHVYGREPTVDLLVVFGDETDEQLIIGGKAEVTLGNIRTVYDYLGEGDSTSLYYTAPNGEENLVAVYDIKPEDKHMFIVNGPEDLGDDTIMDEGIMVEVSDNVLKVTRRVAPHAAVVDEAGTIVVVRTPPVQYTGERNLYAINKDGGMAAETFEYTNPDSNPLIFDIRPNKEMYDDDGNLGGYVTEASIDADTYITIDGADFRTGVRVFVEDIEAEVISRSNDDDQLVVRVPPGQDRYIDRLLRIVVINRDGGTADSSLLSIPRWFRYKKPGSEPVIELVYPDRTSAAGGNRLVIEGDDFRQDATVAIGGVAAANIDTADWTYRRIMVETPTGLSPGVYDLQVINMDFGTATLKNGITIVSWPQIDYIAGQDGSVIDSVSFLGGDTIRLKGSSFMPGARVVFGGEIVPLSQDPDGGGLRGFDAGDRNVALVDGKEAPHVEVVDQNTILLTTPEGVEGETTITVINPDDGISEQYIIDYSLPIPDAPDDLDVSLVYDRYVRLEWPEVEGALYYEIYARERNDDDYRFITSTTRTVYYITDLDSDTRYYFMVKAINRFGSSEFTSRRSIRTEDTREKDIDGGINEAEKISVDGSTLTVNIGRDALDGRYYYAIDLTDPAYSRISRRVINVPLEVVRGAGRTFVVNAEGFMMQFSSSSLNVTPAWSIRRSDEDRSYCQLTIEPAGSQADRAIKYLPAKHRVVSDIYHIRMAVLDGSDTVHCDGFNGQMDLQIEYDLSRLGDMGESRLKLYRFDQGALEWRPVASTGIHINQRLAYGQITRPGIYAVLGEN